MRTCLPCLCSNLIHSFAWSLCCLNFKRQVASIKESSLNTVDPQHQIRIIVTMIISDRVQGVSPSKLPGQGRHAHEPLVPAQVIRKDVQKKSWPCVPHRHLHCTIRRTMATKTKCRIEINLKRLETTSGLGEIETHHHCCVSEYSYLRERCIAV